MLVRRIARIALGSYFLNEARQAFTDTDAMSRRAAPFVEFVSRESGRKVPNDPKLFVRVSGAAQGLGGLALATGRCPRLAALVLVKFAGLNAYMNDAFWAESDKEKKAEKMSNFFRTVAIAGGVTIAAIDTEGKPGIAWRTSHAADAGVRQAKRAANTARLETKLLAAQAGNSIHK